VLNWDLDPVQCLVLGHTNYAGVSNAFTEHAFKVKLRLFVGAKISKII
jgi:hypothetical protein